MTFCLGLLAIGGGGGGGGALCDEHTASMEWRRTAVRSHYFTYCVSISLQD